MCCCQYDKDGGIMPTCFPRYRASYFDQRVVLLLAIQIETTWMLCERYDRNDVVLQASRIHVSVQVLVFVKGSYYNAPWPSFPY